MARQKSAQQVVQDKADSIMNGVAAWCSFYRANPQRFAKDFLNIRLKLFQKILIYMMMCSNYTCMIASRGLGKTWIIALFCVIRCILYPGTKIVVAAGVKSQASEVIGKIKDDFLKNYQWGSSNLWTEILDIKVGQNDSSCEFKNGSWIKVVTANDKARSKRANIIVVDEFRMVSKHVIDTVLRRFLTAPRQPGYLSKPEYAHLQERNKEFYATSAWYSSHWSFQKVKTFWKNMMLGKDYFVVSLPYQIAIKEGLLQRAQLEDEMSEDDFDPTIFSMEMEALFYGDTDGSFFKFDELNNRRTLKNCFYPLDVYQQKDITIPKLVAGEERILSVDVALMSSKKNANDASSLIINSAIPTSETNYISNIVYMQNEEGLTTDELGLVVMRTFYKYRCTQLVVDCNGIGLGLFDYLIKDQYDPQTGETYKAFTCVNDDEMASRCKVSDANKCLWSVKATAQFNNEICILLRTGFQNNKINLLKHEIEGEEILRTKFKSFNKLPTKQQTQLKIPYVQTSALINELVNLEHEIKNGNIKIMEKSGMRKDRYSSLAYNYWALQQIIRKKKPKRQESNIAQFLASASKKADYGLSR